jgi:hypothetical protein
MALELQLPPDSDVLANSACQETTFYVKIAVLRFAVLKGDCQLALVYYALDEAGQPIPVPLLVPELPQVAPVWNPRELMISRDHSAYELAYQAVKMHLRTKLGPAPTILDLP